MNSTTYTLRATAVVAAAVVAVSALALTPQEEILSDSLLRSAKAEIGRMSMDQIDATIQYLAECMPYPNPDRDIRCERATTVLSIKASRAGQFESLRLALFVLDKISPWSRANRTAIDDRLTERRRVILFEFRDAAAERYEAIRAPAK